jgi:hypothetical protein
MYAFPSFGIVPPSEVVNNPAGKNRKLLYCLQTNEFVILPEQARKAGTRLIRLSTSEREDFQD